MSVTTEAELPPPGENTPAPRVLPTTNGNVERVGRAALSAMHNRSSMQHADKNAGNVVTMSGPAAQSASGADDVIILPARKDVRRRKSSGQQATGDGAVMPLQVKPVYASSPEIQAIVELQKQRVFCIKTIGRLDRSVESFVARYLGFSNDLEDKTRKEIFARAAKIRKTIEKGGQGPGAGVLIEGVDPSVIDACAPIVLNSFSSRRSWDVHRNNVEKRMRQLAEGLPVASWVKGIRGFGMLGLAIIVGEAGDIGNYLTKERLWKRMGLAVIDGERQQKRTGVDAAAQHGYNPRRRGEFWTICDSMFRHQWNSEKEDRPAGPAGPYGEVYASRKAYVSANRIWFGPRVENDARRIMGKALLADLHAEWHRAVSGVELLAAE